MKLEIVKTEKMPHLEREEVTATITYEGETPSRQKVRKEVADKQGADEELVFVRNIYTDFGQSKAKVLACVYSSKDAMENVEQKAMIARHAVEEQEDDSEEDSESEDESSEDDSDDEDDSGEDDAGDEDDSADDEDEEKEE